MLTACADPNNLPFSNKAGQGFENKLAQMIAADLHAKLDYVWWAQRRGYVRNTLNERACDFWPGVGSNVEMLATSRPYYRSTYMFVTRESAPLGGLTLDDPRLKTLKIGVQMVGNDGINTPPAHALARRGIIDNVRGYMLYGDYAKPNPPAEIVRAVERGDVDVALVWGPLAGYFAAQSGAATARAGDAVARRHAVADAVRRLRRRPEGQPAAAQAGRPNPDQSRRDPPLLANYHVPLAEQK